MGNIKSIESSLQTRAKVDEISSAELLVNAVDEDFSVNKFTVIDGKSSLRDKMCILDATFAKKNKLNVGDSLTLSVNGQKSKFKIAGLCKSSSYVYITPDSTTVIPNHRNYGYIYIGKNDAAFFTRKSSVINKLSIVADSKVDLQDLKLEVEQIFDGNINSLASIDETLNDLAISQKISQYKTIGALFPIVFFSIVILMSDLI